MHSPSFEQICNPLTQEYFVPSEDDKGMKKLESSSPKIALCQA